MANFVSCDRNRAFLLPPDLRDGLPEDDLAHFVIAAAERVAMANFKISDRNSGSAQDHPRMMLALLIYCTANGIFSARRRNAAAIEAAFLSVLLVAKETGLLRVGTVSIDGTKIDANASKIKSVRYDRARLDAACTRLEAEAAADRAAERAASTRSNPSGPSRPRLQLPPHQQSLPRLNRAEPAAIA